MLGQAEQQAGAQQSGARRPQHRQAAQPAGEHGEPAGGQAAQSAGVVELGSGQRSAHPFCPESSWGLGAKTESYNLGQGLGSQSRLAE